MRNSFFPLALFGLLAGTATASAPVHVALKAAASVSADADGFFTLGSVAVLSGGTGPEREKFRKVRVGRAPLPDETRQITPGDVLLKLRQAGFHPEDDAVLEGAQRVAVTVAACEQASAAADSSDGVSPAAAKEARPTASALAALPPAPNPLLIHRGDAVTIVIQEGDMTISAKGVARDPGGAGDSIRIHRDGLMTDLSATVVDAQTVQLEI